MASDFFFVLVGEDRGAHEKRSAENHPEKKPFVKRVILGRFGLVS